jgi:hypothetical protein
MIQDSEFEEADKVFILKIMKLDPRDRPKVDVLLEDKWFQHRSAMAVTYERTEL